MNLISETHHSCERREYAFMILHEYIIISQIGDRRKNFPQLLYSASININHGPWQSAPPI